MSVETIPMLKWRRFRGEDLTSFYADIDDDEFFIVDYDGTQSRRYRWRLVIAEKGGADAKFLHGHATLVEAKAAAAQYLGDTE